MNIEKTREKIESILLFACEVNENDDIVDFRFEKATKPLLKLVSSALTAQTAVVKLRGNITKTNERGEMRQNKIRA